MVLSSLGARSRQNSSGRYSKEGEANPYAIKSRPGSTEVSLLTHDEEEVIQADGRRHGGRGFMMRRCYNTRRTGMVSDSRLLAIARTRPQRPAMTRRTAPTFKTPSADAARGVSTNRPALHPGGVDVFVNAPRAPRRCAADSLTPDRNSSESRDERQ